MKNFTTFETQLGESVELTDKAKLSLYKKSQNSGYSIDVLEEVYRRGYHCWTEEFGGNPDSFAFDRVNSFIAGGFAEMLDEDLINEKRGLWDNIHAKRARIKAGSGERMRKPGSEGAPTDAAIKASQNEDADPCWKNYKQVGMKMKGGKKVPNCVPVKEQLNAPLPPVETIADKFDKPVSTIKRVIKSGAKVEKEHTKDQKTAEKIATAHVNERPDYYKKLNKAGLEEQEETHSKNPNDPASRFIGSDELVTIYKSQTPGQIIKKVVREAAMAMPPQITPPAVVGQVRPGVRVAPKPTETSGRAAGRMSSQTGSMSARPNVKVSSGVQPSIERSWKTSGRGTMGTSGGSMSATPKVSTAYSQGGANVGGKMAASKQTSPVVKGMTSAGREAAAVVTKAAPTVAKGLGTAARIAGGPAATAAMAVMSPTAANAGEDEKKRQETLKSYNPYKSSGRSVADYEKQTLTPQKYEKPSTPAPKVDAPTPPSRPEYMSRGQAFQAARSEVGGAGGKFSYGGKEYQTNVSGEKYVAKPTTTSVKDESESGGKTLKKIKEAISEDWQNKKYKSPSGGLTKAGVMAYRRENPGSKLQTAVTTEPSKLKPGSKAANRRKSFCARMGGMKKRLTSAKTARDPDSRINKALRKWNCEETNYEGNE